MTALSRAARTYVCAVVAAGLVVGGFALPRVHGAWTLLGLCAVAVACSSLSDVDSDVSLAVSLGFVVAVAAI
ncbi:MAG: hypothetical protein QOE76_57, partial [Frankiales bacterium]|nr:hypothetical protein [Frankiales bacterium]